MGYYPQHRLIRKMESTSPLEQAQKLVDALTDNEKGEIADGFHSFEELYKYRLLYNAGFFNLLAELGRCNVHKSKRHSDGEMCFGDGWFIVMATLPSGQISNHYEMEHWDKFHCEERDRAEIWDGHNSSDVVERMMSYLQP